MVLPAAPDERSELQGFLDWYRAVVEGKAAGLPSAAATSISTPSGLTVLGVVKHLACVERLWFAYYLVGEEIGPLDVAGSFVVDETDTIESALEDYRAAGEASRRTIGAVASLAEPAQRSHRIYGRPTARWIVLHMIEETARHAGHLDILRELTDGRTGD